MNKSNRDAKIGFSILETDLLLPTVINKLITSYAYAQPTLKDINMLTNLLFDNSNIPTIVSKFDYDCLVTAFLNAREDLSILDFVKAYDLYPTAVNEVFDGRFLDMVEEYRSERDDLSAIGNRTGGFMALVADGIQDRALTNQNRIQDRALTNQNSTQSEPCVIS